MKFINFYSFKKQWVYFWDTFESLINCEKLLSYSWILNTRKWYRVEKFPSPINRTIQTWIDRMMIVHAALINKYLFDKQEHSICEKCNVPATAMYVMILHLYFALVEAV